MARVILVSNYLKGGRDARRLAHRTRYFATREGVELLRDDNTRLPPTQKQQDYIKRLLRSFPNSKEFLEYEEYLNAPSRKTAFDFIEQVHEEFIEPMDSRENFIDYVANRPGVQTFGEHGLWDANGKVQSLERAISEVANHEGNVWTPVISLSRENAERFGYTDARNWQALINASICDIAKGYKIHPDHLRWYAAFHRKEKHVHVHMVVFSTDPKEGFLTKQGIRDIKSAFARQIYRDERICIYKKQTEYRKLLQDDAEKLMSGLISQMANGTLQNSRLEQLTLELSQRLKNTTGKKVYGYLPPAIKRIVDEIVNELAKDERVASAYSLWQEMRDEVCRDYNESLPERLPLSQQKEFKPVRNMVIREAMKLEEMTFTFDDEAMEDEPEPEEPQRPADTAPHSRSVYQQAMFYRRAKQVLNDPKADRDEKAAAHTTLKRLWDEGYSIAAHLLGKAYRDGAGTQPDAEEAIKWFRRSAEAGNNCSEYALGKLLLGQQKTEDAIHWLKQAAEHHNQFAQYRLGKIYLSDEFGKKDLDVALDYLTESAQEGNQYAQYTLGKLFLLGHEVRQDKETALRWLSLSAAQGNTYAQYFIDHQNDFHEAEVGSSIIRMLHHMSKIFQENAAASNIYAGIQIDKKRRKRLQEKRMAMGHKVDDHEDTQTQQQVR